MKLTSLQKRFILAAIRGQLDYNLVWPLDDLDCEEIDNLYYSTKEEIVVEIKKLKEKVQKTISKETLLYAVTSDDNYKIIKLESNTYFSIEEGLEQLKNNYPNATINFLKKL